MAAPIAFRTDFDGGSRSDAARAGGMTLQITRDWVLRFNASGPEGLITRKVPGRQKALDEAERRALAEHVMEGPIPAVLRCTASFASMRWPETSPLALTSR
ncbi:helix-turn-helix domain-containing protein [Marivibrio halodurans]